MNPSVKKEIDRAGLLYVEHGKTLSLDERISKMLVGYREAAMRTQKKMQELGVSDSCAVCAIELKECCCFEGAEEKYDSILLLINLLMGVEIPEYREVPGHCLFVGDKGCKMIGRHYFCVNYICPPLKTSLGPTAVEDFLSVAREEFLCGWETEQAVRIWLKQLEDEGI